MKARPWYRLHWATWVMLAMTAALMMMRHWDDPPPGSASRVRNSDRSADGKESLHVK